VADPAEQFGANLRRLRAAAGLTQEALSRRTMLDTGEISRLERGVRDPQLRTIVRVARGLDVPVSELLAGIG
jgi:transcriptional regulator with XRE-family HTH domain